MSPDGMKTIEMKTIEMKTIEMKTIEMKTIEMKTIEMKTIEMKKRDMRKKPPHWVSSSRKECWGLEIARRHSRGTCRTDMKLLL